MARTSTVVDLRQDVGPSVQESTGNINRILDLAGQREDVRQKRQQINDFVSETIRLQGENPTMSPDLISRQAALNISQKDPEFDPGIAGLIQKFAAGARPPDTTTLTGPIAEGLLSEPTGIRREAIKAQIESSRASRKLSEKKTEEIGVATDPLSQTELIGSLGVKIANETATDSEREVFNRLTEKAGTEVTINNIESLVPNVESQIETLKNSQAIINNFTNDPANAEILKNSDVNVVTNTKGQLQLQVKPKGAPAAAQIKELSDIVGLLNSINTIEALFDPEFTGFIEGSSLLAAMAETTGIGTTEKEIQFRRVVSDLSDRLLRARSGAQINEQEFKRLQKILPELGKSDIAFTARLADFKRELEGVLVTKQEAVRQAGSRPLSLGGRPPAPTEKPLDDAPPTPEEQAAIDQIGPAVFSEIQEAATDGTLTADEVKSITEGLIADPTKAEAVLQIIRKRKGK